MYASKSLKKLGADVDVSENGKEACNKVCKSLNGMYEGDDNANKTYDFILIDCEMPVISGYEATRLIRVEEKKHGIHIPLIAFTAHTMDDEMTKPLNAQQLYDLINNIQF